MISHSSSSSANNWLKLNVNINIDKFNIQSLPDVFFNCDSFEIHVILKKFFRCVLSQHQVRDNTYGWGRIQVQTLK